MLFNNFWIWGWACYEKLSISSLCYQPAGGGRMLFWTCFHISHSTFPAWRHGRFFKSTLWR
jgi:hypothetical protein